MQQEYIGRGSIENLPKVIDQRNLKKIFMVTGKDSYVSSGVKNILDPLLSAYSVELFNEYSANPKFEEIMDGVERFRSDNFDCIVAVGGGSAIDVAKSINAVTGYIGKELDVVTGVTKLNKPVMPLIAVPTTAGTGSEATHFAVVYSDGEKYSLASPALLPSVVILDCTLTDSLPKDITAHTGFDALCQAVESYWAKGGTTQSRGYAKQAIQLLLEWLPHAVNKPTPVSRAHVMTAANFAGKAINISKTTAPHALSYGITASYGLAHGYAAALTLGAFFKLHDSLVEESFLNETSVKLFKLLKVKNANEAMFFWYQFMRNCDLEIDFTKLKIYKDELTHIVDSINTERLNNHPVKLNKKLLLQLMNSLADGDHIVVPD